MNTPITPMLLRRTAAAIVAFASFAFAGHASAQTVTLSGASGNSCSYSSMSVLPNGSVSVACTGTVTAGAPGSFSISGPGSLTANTSGSFTISRNGGNTGASTVSHTASGGCSPASGSHNFGDGGGTSQSFTLTAPASGSCTVSISVSGAGTVQSGSMTVSIAGVTTDPTNGAGCPAVPNDVATFDLKLSGADVQRLSSGRIGTATLPTIGSRASGQVILGETSSSPKAARVEISINKCRGYVDTSAGACYLVTDNPSLTGITWLERAQWGSSTPSVAAAYGLCIAYPENGPYYVNMRYTYSSSNCSLGTCGFVSQWNYGAW